MDVMEDVEGGKWKVGLGGLKRDDYSIRDS